MYYLHEFQYSHINIYSHACYIYKGKENINLFTTSRPMQKILQLIA